MVVFSHQWDLMISKVFPDLIDSTIRRFWGTFPEHGGGEEILKRGGGGGWEPHPKAHTHSTSRNNSSGEHSKSTIWLRPPFQGLSGPNEPEDQESFPEGWRPNSAGLYNRA